ncbi:MAG: PIN domain-containing protein [Planctomycetes bacterium]|nr:PIN domain-containing protein [Planctomycetota bacterium]
MMSPLVLVDTSVWIEVFRRLDPLDLEPIVDLEAVVTCLPVVQEVLQGFREETAHRVAREAILSFPVLEDPLGLGVVEEAVDLYRTARRQGISLRSSVDCLIAATALRHDCEVLHRNRDFAALARVSRLRERAP